MSSIIKVLSTWDKHAYMYHFWYHSVSILLLLWQLARCTSNIITVISIMKCLPSAPLNLSVLKSFLVEQNLSKKNYQSKKWDGKGSWDVSNFVIIIETFNLAVIIKVYHSLFVCLFVCLFVVFLSSMLQ